MTKQEVKRIIKAGNKKEISVALKNYWKVDRGDIEAEQIVAFEKGFKG